jgi:hypothetical protein
MGYSEKFHRKPTDIVKNQTTITKQQNPSKPKSTYAQRPEASVHKIDIFFAIVIHMCLVRKPSLLDYWTNFMHKPCNKSSDVSRSIPGNPYNVTDKY